MVTADEVGRIAVFETLEAADRERLARVAADISLAAGSYAVHAGEERALFGVLDGEIEAIRMVEGIEQVVGTRGVGEVFGEVPLTLGTVFPVGFRAAAATRVLRIEPTDYYAVAAVAPEVATKIGKLASNRIGGPGGLQGLAAEPPPPRAIVLGYRWDSACTEIRHFLDRNQIGFRWLQPDVPDDVEQWWGALPGRRRLPHGSRRQRQDGGSATTSPGRGVARRADRA